jgi:hypothetical protein
MGRLGHTPNSEQMEREELHSQTSKLSVNPKAYDISGYKLFNSVNNTGKVLNK